MESTSTDPRGRIVENFAEVIGLEILNSGAPTRIEYKTVTCIDLTIATPTLGPLLQWTVTATPRDRHGNMERVRHGNILRWICQA